MGNDIPPSIVKESGMILDRMLNKCAYPLTSFYGYKEGISQMPALPNGKVGLCSFKFKNTYFPEVLCQGKLYSLADNDFEFKTIISNIVF